jgi:hypothetical protein
VKQLKIEYVDDRSGDKNPGPESFGYVYFNDDTRVGYAPQAVGHLPVWEPRTNGGGKYMPVTEAHITLAVQALLLKGVLTDDHVEQMKTGV